jgi:hypothetical protein
MMKAVAPGRYPLTDVAWLRRHITTLKVDGDTRLTQAKILVGICLTLILLFAVPALLAQDTLNPDAEPAHGVLDLSEGFGTVTRDMQSGGTVRVDDLELGPGCRGYADAAPHLRLVFSGRSNRLRIFFQADEGDSTLVVLKPDGDWQCSDDAYGTRHPAVNLRNINRGEYIIWLGSYEADEVVSGTLYITEENLFPVTEGEVLQPSVAEFDTTLHPDDAEIALEPNFLPDPFEVSMTVGGPVSAYELGKRCRGYVSEAPDVRLSWAGSADLLSVHFLAEESWDTTLVIHTPDNQWLCDDDSYGDSQPIIKIRNLVDGDYAIWVGTFSEQRTVDGQLVFSTIEESNFGTNLLDATLSPNAGQVDLVEGFSPDPYTVPVTAGGEQYMGDIAYRCRGYSTTEPTYRLEWNGDTQSLRFYFVAEEEEDSTLVISDPNGNWLCDDDSYGDQQPLVEIRSPVSGTYAIWAGVYDEGVTVDGSLFIAASLEDAQLDSSLAPSDAELELAAGFSPDPHTVPVSAGGMVQLRQAHAHCRGYANSEADVLLNYTIKDHDPAQLRIFFLPDEDTDTTLAILGPDGVWRCDDDSFDTSHPTLDINNPAPGEYRIWLGTYRRSATAVEGSLYITEGDSNPADYES